MDIYDSETTEHLRIISAEAAKMEAALARIRPTTDGTKQSKSRLLENVVISTLLYVVPIWSIAYSRKACARSTISVPEKCVACGMCLPHGFL